MKKLHLGALLLGSALLISCSAEDPALTGPGANPAGAIASAAAPGSIEDPPPAPPGSPRAARTRA